MSFGEGSRKARWWLEQLKGNPFIYIKGSHDKGIRPTSELGDRITVYDDFEFNAINRSFKVIHDPDRINGLLPNQWVIHGHVHDDRPFMDYKNKRINVSVEKINYTPVSLRDILFEIIFEEACEKYSEAWKALA